MSMMGTSVSGMQADSNWLSTIAQNVANANTTGYKNSETEFAAIVDQVGSAAAAGGGVTTSTRSLNSMQGNVVGTTTTTDLAIQGDGYFVVTDSSGNFYLTRNGSFVPDSQGNLVNSAGYYLMGYDVQSGAAAGSSNSLSGMQKVNVTTSGEQATPSTTGTLAANLDASSAVGATETTSLVAYDNLGGAQTLDLTYTNVSSGVWTVSAADASSPGTPLATATLTFDPTTGKLSSIAQTVPTTTTTITPPFDFSVGVPNGQTLTLDLSSTTQLESAFGVNASTVNGNAPSSLTGTSVSSDGTLNFQYSNGETSPGYEIPIATVPSEDNLTSVNGDAFVANQASGTIRVGVAGSSGLGTVVSSSLESSTVDLATELTDMIEAQSAYQANSKAFQAGAKILDVLNQLQA